jgi:uncharacterized lipoprotein YddW (UPF0748 family)
LNGRRQTGDDRVGTFLFALHCRGQFRSNEKMLNPAIAVASVVLLFAVAARGAQPEVRGTWLTTTANDAISSPQKIGATMKRLREIGLNTVYVECWKNGYTEFPSETMKNAIGIEMKVNGAPPELQRDLLQECIIEAHRNEMLCIAWFEYGFMAAHKSTQNQLRARKDWLSLDQNGNEIAKNGFVWLNPLHPEAQALLIGIVVEAVKKYDLDGIQLDDRIVWPGLEMGYDEFTKKMYAAQNGGKEPPKDIKDPQWCAWRRTKVEEFSKRFVKEVRAAARREIIISLSPGPHPWALENYLIDWPAWALWTGTPKWDEYVPQIYRMNYARFQQDLDEQVKFIGDQKEKLIAGIRLVGDGPDLPKDDVIKSVQACRDAKIGGHCWWFSRGVLEVFPEAIANFYDVAKRGQAPHPVKGAGWRWSIPAAKTAEGWVVCIDAPGRYRVIERRNGKWEESMSKQFDVTTIKLPLSDADAVELLIDRRQE